MTEVLETLSGSAAPDFGLHDDLKLCCADNILSKGKSRTDVQLGAIIATGKNRKAIYERDRFYSWAPRFL